MFRLHPMAGWRIARKMAIALVRKTVSSGQTVVREHCTQSVNDQRNM